MKGNQPRNAKGQFTVCRLRKLKESIREKWTRNKETIDVAVSLFLIWVILTGMMWGFTQKTVTIHECHNVTDGLRHYQYRYFLNTSLDYCIDDTNSWGRYYDPPCLTHEVCNDVDHKEFYTLKEILVQQKDILVGTVSWTIGLITGFFGWIVSHPVV